MNRTASRMTHEAVNERLPWYVNGTLAEDERAEVAAHLEACAVCREDLLLCEEMARAVRSDGAVPIPPATSAEALLERAGGRGRRRLGPDWRMVAAIAIVSVTAAMTYFQVNRDEAPNQRFTTTTGQTSVATVDYVFQLRFETSVDDAVRARIFEDLGGSAQVVDAAAREYRLTLSLPPQSLTDLDARAAAIAAYDEVATADVVALQVPVR
jgi:anti-sigma factor RsiW